jgi:hypothetical protein
LATSGWDHESATPLLPIMSYMNLSVLLVSLAGASATIFPALPAWAIRHGRGGDDAGVGAREVERATSEASSDGLMTASMAPLLPLGQPLVGSVILLRDSWLQLAAECTAKAAAAKSHLRLPARQRALMAERTSVLNVYVDAAVEVLASSPGIGLALLGCNRH